MRGLLIVARFTCKMSEEVKVPEVRLEDCSTSSLCSLLGLRLDFLDRLKEI